MDWFEGVRLKIGRRNNHRYKAFMRRAMASNRALSRRLNSEAALSDESTSNQIDDLAVQAAAHALLLGWEGMTLDDQPIPYSEKKAYELMTEFETLYDDVLAMSGNAEAFRDDEESAKN